MLPPGTHWRTAKALCSTQGYQLLQSATTYIRAESQRYDTLFAQACSSLEIKKSKFLAYAWPVDNPAHALEVLTEYKDSAASHNCWAYKIGDDFRSADDGEPSGTAGRPILAAIEGERLDCVLVLVIRHFGGVKLGAGGLKRAYGQAARHCLQHGQRVSKEPMADMHMQVDEQLLHNGYNGMQLACDQIGTVYALLDHFGVRRLGEAYLDDGSLQLSIRLKQDIIDQLQSDLLDASSGTVTLHQMCNASGVFLSDKSWLDPSQH